MRRQRDRRSVQRTLLIPYLGRLSHLLIGMQLMQIKVDAAAMWEVIAEGTSPVPSLPDLAPRRWRGGLFTEKILQPPQVTQGE